MIIVNLVKMANLYQNVLSFGILRQVFIKNKLIIGEGLNCTYKASDDTTTFSFRCKTKSDPDMTEKYNDLPNDYYVDSCYKTDRGKTAKL